MILKDVLRKPFGSVEVIIQKFTYSVNTYQKALSKKYRTYIAIKIQWNAKGFIGDNTICLFLTLHLSSMRTGVAEITFP